MLIKVTLLAGTIYLISFFLKKWEKELIEEEEKDKVKDFIKSNIRSNVTAMVDAIIELATGSDSLGLQEIIQHKEEIETTGEVSEIYAIPHEMYDYFTSKGERAVRYLDLTLWITPSEEEDSVEVKVKSWLEQDTN